MKLNLLIAICLSSTIGHAETNTELMTPQNYKELCNDGYLVKKAADKKVVDFYNQSKWAIVPAGISADELEAKYKVDSLNDLTYIGTQPAAEADVETKDNESQIYTATAAVYKNKAGTEIQVHVKRSTPLIARRITTSSTFNYFFSDMANSQDASKLEQIDSFEVVEVAGDNKDREKFCDLVATPGSTHFKTKMTQEQR